MKNFLIKLFIFSIAVGVIDYCWIIFMPLEKHIPHVWLILIFFIAITAVFHFFAMQSSKGKPAGIIRFFMSSMVLRFFLCTIIIIGYRFYDKAGMIPFTIGFLAHYFLFACFEAPVMLRELKKS